MEQRRNRVERTHRALPPLFESLHAPPCLKARICGSTKGGERASPVSLPHFGGTNPRCRRATTGRAWYSGTATVVRHGPPIALRRVHRRCEIFGRWRAQMGDWPALSMSANSARRRQCSVANGAPGCANSAFMWQRDSQPGRAARTRRQAKAADTHNLLADASYKLGDAQFAVLRVGVREYPIGIKVA
jgi:hypothetical protein